MSTIVECAVALADKLGKVHANKDFKQVWWLNQQAHGLYTGPHYAEEYLALRDAVAEMRDKGKVPPLEVEPAVDPPEVG